MITNIYSPDLKLPTWATVPTTTLPFLIIDQSSYCHMVIPRHIHMSKHMTNHMIIWPIDQVPDISWPCHWDTPHCSRSLALTLPPPLAKTPAIWWGWGWWWWWMKVSLVVMMKIGTMITKMMMVARWCWHWWSSWWRWWWLSMVMIMRRPVLCQFEACSAQRFRQSPIGRSHLLDGSGWCCTL